MVAPIVAVDDPADERLRDYAGLRRRSPTPADGYFVAEGALVIRQLLESPYPVRSLLVTERGLRLLEPDLGRIEAPVYVAGQDVVDAVAGFHYHRGALAAADRLPLPDPQALAAGGDLLLVAEGVGDHENLGALFRNAAAFGAGRACCSAPLRRPAVPPLRQGLDGPGPRVPPTPPRRLARRHRDAP